MGKTNFDRITASPEALASFLASLPCLDAPWDDDFHRIFCDNCPMENCPKVYRGHRRHPDGYRADIRRAGGMKKLIAKRPVLYLGRMYDKGDTLPANDQKMVTAWLNAKSAAWDGQEAKESRQEAQESAKQADGSQDSRGQNGGQEAQENGQGAEMVEGHLDPDQLATMKKAGLEKLAARLGVDISGAKNNKERAELIAATTVQAPANETGGAH